MSNYRPNEPFVVPLWLLIPQTKLTKGITKKVYPETGILFYASFKTFGGTERTNNDVVTIEDTAIIETWYRPDIKADCRIQNADGKTYEVIGTPENINMRNQILKFKIRAVSGGA